MVEKTLDNRRENIRIREYRDSDETCWVRVRVLSFIDTSYLDDVHRYREVYENPAVRLVAENERTGQLVGLLDIEYEEHPGDVCNFPGERGGVIWHLAVLPEYRRQGIANALWKRSLQELKKRDINRLEIWTQDDEAANRWYHRHGFKVKHAYLNVYSRGFINREPINELLPDTAKHWKYGHIRSLNFEADLKYRSELEALSYRIHEVRGYEITLNQP